MSLPQYPKYKDSRVPWLGEVPERWSISQSRRLFSLRKETVLPDDKQLTASQAHGVIYQDDFMEREGRAVVRVIHGAEILKHVEPNDFVISMRSFQGGIEWCGERGCISSAYVMLIPSPSVNPDFFRYLFKSSRYIQALQSTTNLVRDGQAMRFDNFTQLDLPLVPANEQTAIAAFLDRETAKIDALVAEQRRLIELLKEKRQGVISHAVTKGLNPDAPMKDSGIKWLGEVPSHWHVQPLRRFPCSVQTGPFGSQLHAEEYIAGGTPVINPVNIVGGRIVPSEDVTVSEDVVNRLRHQRLQDGDIVFSRRGELGRCALVSDVEVGWLCGTGSMIVRLLHAIFLAGYLSVFLSLGLLRQYFESFSVGSIMDSLSSGTLLSMPMIVPPLREQATIVAFVEIESNKIDALTADATRAVDLLQERRTALISAAVTGKIDVRGMAKEQTA